MKSYFSHQQARPDCDHQLEPGREPGNDLGDEGSNGVSIVWLVELCFTQTVNQYDVVFFRQLPLCGGVRERWRQGLKNTG